MKVAIIIYLDGTVDIDTRQGSPGWASSAQEIFSMALFRRRMGRRCRWCKCKTILLFVQRVEELATGCVQGQRPIESRVNEGTRLEIRLFPISLLFKEETREITTGANLDDKLNSARDNCFQLQNDMALSQVCIRKPVNRAGIEQLKTQWERVRERRAERERGEIRPGRQRINNWQSELDESDFFLNFWSSSPKPPLRFHGASRLHPLSRRPSPLPSQDSLALLLPLLSSLVPSLVSSPLPLHCVFTYWNFVKKSSSVARHQDKVSPTGWRKIVSLIYNNGHQMRSFFKDKRLNTQFYALASWDWYGAHQVVSNNQFNSEHSEGKKRLELRMEKERETSISRGFA